MRLSKQRVSTSNKSRMPTVFSILIREIVEKMRMEFVKFRPSFRIFFSPPLSTLYRIDRSGIGAANSSFIDVSLRPPRYAFSHSAFRRLCLNVTKLRERSFQFTPANCSHPSARYVRSRVPRSIDALRICAFALKSAICNCVHPAIVLLRDKARYLWKANSREISFRGYTVPHNGEKTSSGGLKEVIIRRARVR